MPNNRRKTQHQKELLGTARASRVVQRPPADTVHPKPPAELSNQAKKIWRWLCHRMAEDGTLRAKYLGAMAGWCAAWARCREMEAILKRDGPEMMRQGASGQVNMAKHHLLQPLNMEYKLMRSFQADLGLSPKDAQALDIAETPSEDEALGAQYLRGDNPAPN